MTGTTTLVLAPEIPDVAARRRAAYSRLVIFATALTLRTVTGSVFFGSIDIINASINSVALWAGLPIDLPYFPSVNPFLWFAGILPAILPVPFALALKLAPILFDAVLAVLIYDLVARTAPRLAFRAGLLYAVNPLALLITSFHGQSDSIGLFFLMLAFAVRESGGSVRRRESLFGALLALSLLAKPIALPFLALLPKRRGERTPEWPAVAGLVLTLGAAFAIFGVFGYSPGASLVRIGSYSVAGVQVFGLPFAPGLAKFTFLSHRLLWLSPLMLLLAILYHRGRLAATDVMLLFYLFSLATAGISPQYLLWPLPLLIAARRLRLAAVYTGVTTLFLLLYYMNPWASYFPSENLATFAPLRGFAWMLPPAALATRELLPLVHALGNVIFPACAFTLAILVYRSAQRPVARSISDAESGWRLSHAAWYAFPTLLLGTAILVAKWTIHAEPFRLRVFEAWKAIPAQYAMHVQSLKPSPIFVGDFGSFQPLNIVVLMAVLATIWCAAAAGLFARNRAEGQPEEAGEGLGSP